MPEKFTVTINPDGTMVLTGDEGSTMNIGGATPPTITGTGNATSSGLIRLAPYASSGTTLTIADEADEEDVEVQEPEPVIVNDPGGRHYCNDCSSWLDGPPVEWTHISAELYYDGDEEDYDQESEMSIERTTYLRGSCGCEFEPLDGGCFTTIEQGGLVWRCPRCGDDYPDQDMAVNCEESCRLYG